MIVLPKRGIPVSTFPEEILERLGMLKHLPQDHLERFRLLLRPGVW